MSKASKKRRRQQLEGGVPAAPSSSSTSPLEQPPATQGNVMATRGLSKTQKRKLQKKRAAKRLAEELQTGAAEQRRHSRAQEIKAARTRTASTATALAVAHEDSHVIVVNKAAGMLCHPSPGYWERGTVVHALPSRERRPGFSAIAPEMLEARQEPTGEADSFIPRAIVHRLDKGTTGVLLIAKTPEAEAHLAEAFRRRTISKRYVALVQGQVRLSATKSVAALSESSIRFVNESAIEVSAPIDKDPEQPGRMRVHALGKAARSRVHLHAWSPEALVSLVSVELFTGRTHQIRVHCAHVDAPLVNDDVYGRPEDVSAARERYGPLMKARPMLHSWRVKVAHPDPGKKDALEVSAALPEDMARIIRMLWSDLGTDPAAWPLAAIQP